MSPAPMGHLRHLDLPYLDLVGTEDLRNFYHCELIGHLFGSGWKGYGLNEREPPLRKTALPKQQQVA